MDGCVAVRPGEGQGQQALHPCPGRDRGHRHGYCRRRERLRLRRRPRVSGPGPCVREGWGLPDQPVRTGHGCRCARPDWRGRRGSSPPACREVPRRPVPVRPPRDRERLPQRGRRVPRQHPVAVGGLPGLARRRERRGRTVEGEHELRPQASRLPVARDAAVLPERQPLRDLVGLRGCIHLATSGQHDGLARRHGLLREVDGRGREEGRQWGSRGHARGLPSHAERGVHVGAAAHGVELRQPDLHWYRHLRP